jgi:hypothetical protein
MSHLSPKLCFTFLAMITTMLVGNEAFAQLRRTAFGTSRVSLATLAPIQDELKLNDEQKKLADELHDQLIEDRREVFQNRGGDWDGMRKELEKLDTEATNTLNGKLENDQKRRLTEIYVQANGPNALADAAVIEILDLTDDQKNKLEDIRQANRDDMFDAFQDFPNMSDEERRETMGKLREDADASLLAALTDEQREAFTKLPGEEVDYDLSVLRGGFPGGGRGSRPTSDSNRPQRPE